MFFVHKASAGVAASEPGPQRRRAFHGLDALRGYAALLVVIFHAGTRTGLPLVPGGYLAVDLFFVMSGFVIAYSYDEGRLRSLGFGGFARVRIIRFYPLYLVGLGLGLALALALMRFGNGPPIALRDVLMAVAANAVFLPSPASTLGPDIFPLDVPAWSLMFELAINLAYAACVLRRRDALIAPFAAVAAIALCVVAVRDGSLAGGTEWATLDVGLARVAFSFPLGVLLFRYRDRFPDLGRYGLLVPPLLLAILCLPASAPRDLIFVLLVSPLMVLVAFRARPAFPPVAKYLAAISYCIYVIHHPVLASAGGLAKRFGVEPIGPVAGAIVLLMVGCYALDSFYDLPARRWLLARTRPSGPGAS